MRTKKKTKSSRVTNNASKATACGVVAGAERMRLLKARGVSVESAVTTSKDKRLLSVDERNYKKRNSRLSGYIYDLPLPIKRDIYRIAIQSNMARWKRNHVKKTSSKFDNLMNWHLPYGCLDIIRGLGIQHSEPNYFDSDIVGGWVFQPQPVRNKIPTKFKTTLCRKDRVVKQWGRGTLDTMNKVDIFDFEYGGCTYVPYSARDHIERRRLKNHPHKYWVHKRCRCLTCDSIRLVYTNQCRDMIWEGYKNDTPKERKSMNANTYKNIDMGRGGQWYVRVNKEIESISVKLLKSTKKQEKLSKKK